MDTDKNQENNKESDIENVKTQDIRDNEQEKNLSSEEKKDIVSESNHLDSTTDEVAQSEKNTTDESVKLTDNTDEIEIIDDEAKKDLEKENNVDDSINLIEDESEIEEEKEESPKKEISKKDLIMNRIMIGFGICIAAFTIFYTCSFLGVFEKKESADDTNQETNIVEGTEQETEEKFSGKQFETFTSPYSEKSISKKTKTLLKDVKLNPEKSMGVSKVDSILSAALKACCKDSMNTYEKVRSIYDYVIYFFDHSTQNEIKKEDVSSLFAMSCYQSDFDAELSYRSYMAINALKGDTVDYASIFTCMLRKLGLDAYYVKSLDLESGQQKGYTVVMINDKKYLFDVAKEDIQMKDDDLEYDYFCIEIDEKQKQYNSDFTTCKEKFKQFEMTNSFSLEAMVSSENESVFGNVNYINPLTSDCNMAETKGDLQVSRNEVINLAANFSGDSVTNTWKLVEKKLDDDGNVIEENIVYQDITDSKYNETSYTVNKLDNVLLEYSVTDSLGRTVMISTNLVVSTKQKETQTKKEEPTTKKNIETKKNNNASAGEIDE